MPVQSQSGPLVAGIDIGTTAVKAVVVDEDGRALGRSRVPSALIAGPDGHFEHDAAETWWRAPVEALTQAALSQSAPALAPGRAAVVGAVPSAVAVSAMMPSVAAVGQDGRPIGKGLLYGDSRGHGGTSDQVSPMASPEMGRLCGWLASQMGPVGKGGPINLWPAQAVANASLGGPGAVDLATAFAYGPLYNGSTWDAEACAVFGVAPGQLPKVAVFGEALGEVPAPWGGQLVLGAGSVDGFCEQLVSGAVDDGDVLVCLGSALLVWLTVPGWPDEPEGLWRVPHLVGGKAAVGGASNAGGLWVRWARRLFSAGTPDGAEFGGRTGAGLRPGDVPIWYPWARGERVPLHDRSLRAALVGAHASHGPDALLRAAYEASAFLVRYITERAATTGTAARRFVVSGGGVQDKAWLQALADVLGQPVVPLAVPESAALGSAFLARMASGWETSLDDARRWVVTSEPVEPSSAWLSPADDRYHRWSAGLPSGGP